MLYPKGKSALTSFIYSHIKKKNPRDGEVAIGVADFLH